MPPTDNWTTLYKTIELICKAAGEVGDRMEYPYPEERDRRSMGYLKKIENKGR
jgi:hypothetical protein